MASSDALQATARSSLCVERTLSQSPTITQDKSCRNQRQLFIKNKSFNSWHTLCTVHPLWETIFRCSHYYLVSLSFWWDARNAVDSQGSELQIHPSIHKLERLNASKSTKPGVAVNDKIDVKPAAWPSLRRRRLVFLNLNLFLSPFWQTSCNHYKS